MKALENFQLFLQDDLLPKSQGDFRIGADNFRQKLLDEEMVNIPLDQLLKIGYADLHRNQQRLKETAALINPNASPRDVLASLEKDHPAARSTLAGLSQSAGSLREFIEAKKIVTIPSPILPILEETPPFMRATTTASMDTPGAYESQATEAMFNVTLPQSGWTPQHVEDWMEGFNRGTILSTAIHEAYPGHYVQFLWVKRLNSKVRKLLYCNSNVEGWAHYTEQMMLDEGYGGGDPKLRMGQLQDALLRNARFIVGIEMHTGNMTMDQAKEFFIREGYQVPAVADIEAKRGTADPTYLVYTLGKLQILKLREDYKKKLGNKFTLQDFHDRFMEQGGVPLDHHPAGDAWRQQPHALRISDLRSQISNVHLRSAVLDARKLRGLPKGLSCVTSVPQPGHFKSFTSTLNVGRTSGRVSVAPNASRTLPPAEWRPAQGERGRGESDMNYRRFGRTGWMVSEIGYGMWGMGGWTGSDDARVKGLPPEGRRLGV